MLRWNHIFEAGQRFDLIVHLRITHDDLRALRNVDFSHGAWQIVQWKNQFKTKDVTSKELDIPRIVNLLKEFCQRTDYEDRIW